jgi:hypothetical protein
MMEIIGFLRSKPASEQARLLGSMSRYIKNDGIINLMQGYDINNKQKDESIRIYHHHYSGSLGRRCKKQAEVFP